MSRAPGSTEVAIREARESIAGDGEPLNSETGCKVIDHGGALYVCVTWYGQKTHSLKKGDTVTVHTCSDTIKIEPEGKE
jgi:hypothetical protein